MEDTHELDYWHQNGDTGRLPSGPSLVRKVCLDNERRPLCMGDHTNLRDTIIMISLYSLFPYMEGDHTNLAAWEDPSFKAKIDGLNLHSEDRPFNSILVVPLVTSKAQP